MYNTFDIFEGVDLPKKISDGSMIPNSFTGLIVGKPGSGKSSLLKQMLVNENCLYKKFDLTLFMAPYEIADLDLKSDRKIDTLNIPWVYESISLFQEKKNVRNVLVVIDDLISSIKKDGENPALIDFMFNRRKIFPGVEISIICTSQKYTMFPAKFRSCLQWMIFFAIPPDDFKTLSQQQIYTCPPHLQHTLDSHFKMKQHNFCYLRLDKSAIFLNFSKQIL